MISRKCIAAVALFASVGAVAWAAGPVGMTMASAQAAGGYAPAACVDSQGATTAFYCAPRTARGTTVPACAIKTRDVEGCRASAAAKYCVSRAYQTAQSFRVDARGNLSELVCMRPATASEAVAEWQPMFNANIQGYDRREFVLGRSETWKRCRAACDADSGCNAWTVSNENRTCYLKWDGNPELVSYNACCTTGLKGMESGGPASVRARLRSGG